MSYKVGNLHEPEDNDATASSEHEAFQLAVDTSEDLYEDCFGVWVQAGNDWILIAIAHQGELFKQA